MYGFLWTSPMFLAHLSTKCSEWAIVITHRPSAFVRRPLSVRRPFTFPCLHSSIDKYQPISTKLGQNVYDHKISDNFDYGSDRTWTTGVICPWIRKFAIFDCLHSSICKYWPVSTKLGHNVFAHEGSDEFDHGSNWTRTYKSYLPLNLEKLLNLTLFTL